MKDSESSDILAQLESEIDQEILSHITEKDRIIEEFPFFDIYILAHEKRYDKFDAKKLKDLLKHDFSKSRYQLKPEYVSALKNFALKALIMQEPSYISHISDQETRYLCSLSKEELASVLEAAYRSAKSALEKESVVHDMNLTRSYLKNMGFLEVVNKFQQPLDKAIYILSELANKDVTDLMKEALRAYYAFEIQLTLPKFTVPKFLRNAIDRIPSIVDEIIDVDHVIKFSDSVKYKCQNILAFPIEQLEKLYNVFLKREVRQDFKQWVLERVEVIAQYGHDIKNLDRATVKEKIGHAVSEFFTSNVTSVYTTVSNMQNVMQIKGVSK
ncbi:MAG: hypothetical protein ACK5V4_02780, partial [Alphaproteobacteria bacterium]